MNRLTHPHIIISVPDVYPDQLIFEDLKSFQDLGVSIETRKTESLGLMAGVEWAIGTAFVVYLLKPFFDTFLGEMGKDSYNIVKESLVEYVKEKRKLKVRMVAATGSSKKLSSSYDQSLSVSIKALVVDGFKVTILVNDSIGDDNLQGAITAAIDSLLNLRMILEMEKAKAEESGSPLPRPLGDAYLLFNLEDQAWEHKTQLQMAEKYRNR